MTTQQKQQLLDAFTLALAPGQRLRSTVLLNNLISLINSIPIDAQGVEDSLTIQSGTITLPMTQSLGRGRMVANQNFAFAVANGARIGDYYIASVLTDSSVRTVTFPAGSIVSGVADLDANSNYDIICRVYSENGVDKKYKFQIVKFGESAVVLPPAAPSGLAASGLSSSSFTLTWSAVSGATYRVDVSTQSDFSTFVSGYQNVSTSTNSLAISGLSASTQYYCRVRSVNSAGTSSNSSTLPVLTSSGASAPATPTGLAVSKVGYKTNTLSWSAVSGATGYRLYQKAGSPTGAYTQVADIPGTTTKISGLTQGNDYNYKIEAYNGTGASPLSSVVSTRTRIITANRSLGDSYTNSVGDPGDGYIEKWVAGYSFTNVNLAESARGFFRAAKAANGLAANATFVSIMAALNDMRRSGVNALTIAKLKACLRSILAKHWRSVALPVSNSAFFNRVGFANTYFSGFDGEFASSLTGLGVFTQSASDYITHNFSGDNLVIGYLGTTGDASNDFAPFDVYIDNAVGYTYTDDTNPVSARTPWLTVTPNGQADGITDDSAPNPGGSGTHTNSRVPAAVVIRDIPYANSVLKIQSRSNGTQFCVVDWVGTQVAPAVAKPVHIFQVPLLPPDGYAIAPNLGSNAAMNAASTALQEVIAEFVAAGYPAYYVPLTTHNGKILAGDYSNFDPAEDIHPISYQDMYNDLVNYLD